MGQPKYPVKRIVEAVHKATGFTSKTAEILGCNPSTITRYIKRFPLVAQAVQDEREALLDDAEIVLRDKIREEHDLGAVTFYLTHLGKERGYVPRSELTGKDGAPIALGLLAIVKEITQEQQALPSPDTALAAIVEAKAVEMPASTTGAGHEKRKKATKGVKRESLKGVH